MASYYGSKPGGGPVFLLNPRPKPQYTNETPSAAAMLNMEITKSSSFKDVLDIFQTRKKEFDSANACTSVSSCARRCKEIGSSVAYHACLSDPRWSDLLEFIGTQVRVLSPRNLTMTAWGLATLKAHQPLLAKRLAWQTVQKLDLFDARTLANIIWAFATLDVRDFEINIVGCALYPQFALRAIHLLKQFRPQELANILWAFATLALRHSLLFQAAAETISAMIQDLNPYDLGQTVWSFATVRLRDDSLFGAIACRIKQGEDDNFHKPINISNLCWAYAKVEYKDNELFHHLASIAKTQMPRANPQDLCNVVWSLATVRVTDERLCEMMCTKAKGLLHLPGHGGFTSQEIATLLWSFAKLDELDEQLFELSFVSLTANESLLSINQKETSMCLWALQHFGMTNRAWTLFEQFLAIGTNPGITSYSHLLAMTQDSESFDHELQTWQRMLDSTSHPLLSTAVIGSMISRCLHKGEVSLARRIWQEMGFQSSQRNLLHTPGAMLACSTWRVLGRMCSAIGAVDEEHSASIVNPLPPIAPKRDEMTYEELYAKELSVLAALDAKALPGNAESVVREIEALVEGGEDWLKLAGGEKAVVLDSIIEQRRPKLVVEIGFYVGYSSTRMARLLQNWGGQLVSIEVDPVHAAIGRMSNVLAGLSDIVDVWVGHSADIMPRLLRKFGPRCVDMAFFDQKGTIYHKDAGTLESLNLLADSALIVADNVLKPGAPYFLWELHHHPHWDLQIISLREYSSEDIEDWISVARFHAEIAAERPHCHVPSPPRSLENLAFETDAMRWRAMTEQLNVSDWVRHCTRVRDALREHGICSDASVENGNLVGFTILDFVGSVNTVKENGDTEERIISWHKT